MNDKTTMYQLEKNLIDELNDNKKEILEHEYPSDLICLLYTSPSPRDGLLSRMPSSA